MKLTKNILAVLVGVSLGLGGTAFAVTNVSLTKNRALQYLNYIADSFLIGGTATTSDARLSVVGSTTVTGTGIFGGELRVPYFTATSTSATSTIASMLRVSNYALDSAGLRAIQAPTYITTETSSAGGNANAPDVIIKPGDGLGSGRGGEINLMPGFSDPLGSGPLGDGPRNGNITITNLLGGSFATLDVDGIRGSYTTHFPFEDATVTSRFIRLTDAPQDYTSHANKLVGVLADESGLEFKFLNFINLADVTNTYSGAANYLVAVRPDESGLEFIANPGSASSTLLGDGNHWSVTQYFNSFISNASSTIQLLMTNNATSTNFETTNLKVGTLTGLLKASNGGVTTATVGSDYQAPLGAGTKGQILGYLGTGVPTWVATTTFSAPLVFSAGNVTCTTAASGIAGCLSNTSFDTFNGKESALTFGSLLTRAANVITGSSSPSFAFLNATSTDYASFIRYASSTSITTTASSTLGDIISSGLSSFNRLLVTGAGTSTKLSGSLSVASAIDSGTATSTFFGLQSTNGMRVLSLASCDTVDTDASGNFKCGADATGGASSGFIVNATGTPGQMAAFSAINTLVSTSTINIAQIDATSTLIASRFPYASTTAITTTATSTMGDIYSSTGLLSYARLNVTGAGTSTILTGALQALNFQMTGTGTSTAAGGINITSGCFAVNGVCVGGGSAALTGGESGSFAYWTSASTLAATSSPVFPYFTATSTSATSTVKWRFSVGTSTSNEINFMPDVVGTSTFTSGYGLDLTAGGCYAISGTCVSGVVALNGGTNQFLYKTGAQATQGGMFYIDAGNQFFAFGTSSAMSTLTVAATSSAQLLLTDPNGTTNNKHVYASSSNGIFTIGGMYDTPKTLSPWITMASSSIGDRSGAFIGIGTTSPRKLLEVVGNIPSGVARIHRYNANTNSALGTFDILAESQGDMTDGFGAAFTFSIQDTASGIVNIADIRAIRDGGDTSGALTLHTKYAGTMWERFRIGSNGNVSVGTTTRTYKFSVNGRVSSQPQFDCPVLINTVTAVVADQLGSATLAPTLCNGNMGWDMQGTTDGRIPAVTAALDNFVASGTPPMQLIDVAYTAPNNGGTSTTEGGVAMSQALLGSATSSGGIAMEMFLATPTMTNALATTSFVAFAGFTSNTFVSTTSLKAWYGHKDSCMLIATSTPNWQLVCRNASVYYGKDTGVATTSTPFKILLTLNQDGFSAYFNNSNTAAANIPPANVPSAHLRAAIGAGTLAECSSISGGAAQLASQCGISTAKGTNALNIGQLTVWASNW
jgi:hypothetical protein